MASWLKVEFDLHKKPQVTRIATALKQDRRLVAYCCEMFWQWAQTASVDGFVEGYDAAMVDCEVDMQGFAEQMVAVKWLSVDKDGIRIPNWEEHNSDGAKERAQTAARVAKSRGRNASGVTKTLPDKNREEKRREEEKLAPLAKSDGGGEVQKLQVSESAKETMFQAWANRLGNDPPSYDVSKLVRLKARCNEKPITLDGKPVDGEDVIIAAIRTIKPDCRTPIQWVTAVVDRALTDGVMPGEPMARDGPPAKIPVWESVKCVITEDMVKGKPK